MQQEEEEVFPFETMTEREVFDTVKAHLLKQKERSIRSNEICAYRGINGLKCAAGILIPDKMYSPDMEIMWHTLCEEGKVPSVHSELICLLQKIHDQRSVNDWETELNELEAIVFPDYKPESATLSTTAETDLINAIVTDIGEISVDISELMLQVRQLSQEVLYLEKMTVKKAVSIVELNGKNEARVPKDNDLHIQIFTYLDTRGGRDGTTYVMQKLSSALATWSSKPGFRILAPLACNVLPEGNHWSVIVGVTRMRFSQEDVVQG